jgi:hypothetical protein
MRLARFSASVARSLRCLSNRFASSRSPRSVSMPKLVSTFIIGTPKPELYTLTDGIVRPDKIVNLGDAFKLVEQDPIWANRGKAIQGYAMLEQAFSSLLSTLGGMTRETATTIFYKITNTGSRNSIIEKLLHAKYGTRFNLFWNAYLKEMRQIDLKRNEIVHWLTVMYAAMNTQNMMIVGIALIPPGQAASVTDNRITSDHLIAFAEKCDVFARLCHMFWGVIADEQMPLDAKQSWLEIFERPLVYPLPEGHLLNQTPSGPDSPPQSSPA